MFADRAEAGKRLAERLKVYGDKDPVVLAIPRGGVVVAGEVAKVLSCPLDVIIPRKIGAPGNPELAIGAVAGKEQVMLNESLIESVGASRQYLKEEIERQVREIERRRKEYLGERKPQEVEGRTAILVDDGLATGYTALAAVGAVRIKQPKKIVLAVPVAPKETCGRLEKEVDELVCLSMPELFFAVGQFYSDFRQTTDDEVIQILNKHAKDEGRGTSN